MFIRSTLTVFILNHQGDKNKYQCSTKFDNSTLQIGKNSQKVERFKVHFSCTNIDKDLRKGLSFCYECRG